MVYGLQGRQFSNWEIDKGKRGTEKGERESDRERNKGGNRKIYRHNEGEKKKEGLLKDIQTERERDRQRERERERETHLTSI